MQWEFDNERPIYAQITEQVERAIVAGKYTPGEKLPGVREMAEQAKVNPNTMQRALADLEGQGLLVSQRTSGRFVTDDSEHIAALRQQLATGATRTYLENMAALGCSQQEIAEYVQKAKGE